MIGIDEYEHAVKLRTPSFDADLVARTLRKLDPNFVVTRVPSKETTRAGLLSAIEAFAKTVQIGEVAFVFFSGHGLERDGVNYLVPANAQLAEPGREGFTYVSLPYLIEQIQEAQAGISIVILDACRVNPFAGTDASNDLLESSSGSAAAPEITANPVQPEPSPSADPVPVAPAAPVPAGLKEIKTPQGFIVAYAAEPGKPSYSLFKGDAPDKGSIFTRRFVDHVSTLNKSIQLVFNVTGGDVYALTSTKQKPFVNTFNAGEVLLLSNNNLEKDEQEMWARTVADSPPDQQLSGLRVFLSIYPAGPYAAAARARIQQLERGASPPVQLARLDPPDVIRLSGALKTPAVMQVTKGLAIAKRDVYVRAAPYASFPKVIASLKAGDEVQVLAGSARPGWAKVILQNGTVGYVGSVATQTTPVESARLSLKVMGDDIASVAEGAVSTAWRNAFKTASSAFHINVGPSTDSNPWRARQVAFLRGLRLRSALIAQGVNSSRITLALGDDRADADTATVTIVRGTQ